MTRRFIGPRTNNSRPPNGEPGPANTRRARRWRERRQESRWDVFDDFLRWAVRRERGDDDEPWGWTP